MFYYKIHKKAFEEGDTILYDIFEDIKSEKRFDLIFNQGKIIKIINNTEYEYIIGGREYLF